MNPPPEAIERSPEQVAAYVRMSRLLTNAGFELTGRQHDTQQAAEDKHGRRAVMTLINDGTTEVELSYVRSDRIDLAYDPQTLERLLTRETR